MLNLSTIFVFSVWPAINFLSVNLDLGIQHTQIFLLAVATFILGAGLYWIARKLVPQLTSQRIAGTIAVAIAVGFQLQLVRQLLSTLNLNWTVAGTWLVLSIMTIAATFIVVRNRRSLGLVFAFGFAALAAATFNYAANSGLAKTINLQSPVDLTNTDTDSSGDRPSIYYFLVDAYGRNDQLKHHAGYDNSDFLAALRDRGFRILDEARSNYYITDLSIPSLLSMDYPVRDGRAKLTSIREALLVVQGHNPVFDTLRSLEYRLVTSGSRLCSERVDRCLVSNSGLNYDAWQFAQSTPLPLLLSYISPGLYGRLSRSGVPSVAEIANSVARMSPSNLFVLAHVMEVHDGAYESDCEFRTRLGDEDLLRMNEAERMLRTSTAYIESIQCVNRMLINAIDSIVANSPDAIIVIAADHGSAFSKDQGEFDEALIDERTAILSAWRLPASCDSQLYDAITPVNYFRLLLACAERRPPEFIDDSIIPGWTIDSALNAVPIPLPH